MSPGCRNIKIVRTHFRRGGILAYPTESSFGLGCNPRDFRAIQRLLRLKKRPQAKGLLLIAHDVSVLKNWVGALPPELLSRLEENATHPCTWLVPAGRLARRSLRGRHNTIGIRIIRHPGAAQLCRALASPLVSTSANFSGKRPCTTAAMVRSAFGQKVRLIEGRVGGNKSPSTIRDIFSNKRIR